MYKLQIVDADSKTRIMEQDFDDVDTISLFIENCQNGEGFCKLVDDQKRILNFDYINHVEMKCGENTFYRVYSKIEFANIFA